MYEIHFHKIVIIVTWKLNLIYSIAIYYIL